MTELWLIGIGTGNPDHITTEGQNAIKNADLILIPRKGPSKSDLADLRLAIVDNVRGKNAPIAEFDLPVRDANLAYLDAVDRWHDEISRVWAQTIVTANPSAKKVALLVWGDPSLYDSTLRIAARLDPKPELRVVPGITSLQALTAAHAIALNSVGAPVTITTGRQLRDGGWPAKTETLAVMLDGGCAFQELPGQSYDIWWGAFLGMPEQLLVSGRLRDVSQTIQETRAKGRSDHGWIMDIYILRRIH